MGQTESPYINQMHLEHPETGYPQTIYSATHPVGEISTPPYQYTPGETTQAIMYPQIRFRSPGFLERLTEDQAYREAMQNQATHTMMYLCTCTCTQGRHGYLLL